MLTDAHYALFIKIHEIGEIVLVLHTWVRPCPCLPSTCPQLVSTCPQLPSTYPFPVVYSPLTRVRVLYPAVHVMYTHPVHVSRIHFSTIQNKVFLLKEIHLPDWHSTLPISHMST